MSQADDWATKTERVRAHFPELIDPDWAPAFADTEILGGTLRALITVGFGNGKRGPRETPDMRVGLERLRELTADDLSLEPFAPSLQRLRGPDSLRAVAAKSYISPSRLHRLSRGVQPPSMVDMEQIAAAYSKQPIWFHEYRVNMIAAVTAAMLNRDPERSAVLANQLVHLVQP